MLRVGIIGASGYTGVELARILTAHPLAELTVATSRQYAGRKLASIFPNLRTRTDLVLASPDMEQLVEHADFFFTAVPHKTAMDIVPGLLAAGKKVVDLSADFRLKDRDVYEQWYQSHSCSELLEEAVYGLPEIHREDIARARLVANPGCYPTSVILGLMPLLKKQLIRPETIIVDSKSGTTGAGRTTSLGTMFCEVNDGFRAYKVGGCHRHIPEMEQELSLLAGDTVTISFTPHLLPISRGIFSTIYSDASLVLEQQELIDLYEEMYAREPFVRVCGPDELPATQYVRGGNYCDIAVQVDRRTSRVIVLAAEDNIVKGAAGQAVQNMNIMHGFAEGAGLDDVPLFP